MAEKIVYDIEFKGLKEGQASLKELTEQQVKQADAVKNTKDKLKGYEKALKDLSVETTKAGTNTLENTAKRNKLNVQIKNTKIAVLKENDALKVINKSRRTEIANITTITSKNQSNAGSNRQLRAELKLLTTTYDGLSREQRENTTGGAKLTAQIEKISSKLKQNEKAVGDNRREVGNYGNALKGARAGLLKFAGALGLVGGLTLFVNGIKKAVGVMKDFEQGNANLAAILGTTKEQIGLLTEDAKRLGSATSFTATQVTELQTEFAKLGFNETEIVNATEATLNLAAATGSDLATAAAIAGATLGGFGLDADQTARVTDVMAQSFSKSALDLEKFKESMKTAAPAAAAVGVSVEQTTALLGTLANAGINGSKAGTALKKTFIELNAEGISMDDAFAQVTNSSDQLGAAVDLVGKLAAPAFLVLANGTENTAELEIALNGAGGAAEKMANEQLNTLEGSLKLLSSAWQGVILDTDNTNGIVNKLKTSIQFLTANLDKIILVTKAVVKGFVAYKVTMIAINGVMRLATAASALYKIAVTALSGGVSKARAIMIAFNTAVKANPIGLIATAIGLAVAAFTFFAKGADKAKKAQKGLNDEVQRGQDILSNQKSLKDRFAVLSSLSNESKKALKSDNEAALAAVLAQDAAIKTSRTEFYATTKKEAQANLTANQKLQIEANKIDDNNLKVGQLNQRSTLIALRDEERKIKEKYNKEKNDFDKAQNGITFKENEKARREYVKNIAIIDASITAEPKERSSSSSSSTKTVDTTDYAGNLAKYISSEAEKSAAKRDAQLIDVGIALEQTDFTASQQVAKEQAEQEHQDRLLAIKHKAISEISKETKKALKDEQREGALAQSVTNQKYFEDLANFKGTTEQKAEIDKQYAAQTIANSQEVIQDSLVVMNDALLELEKREKLGEILPDGVKDKLILNIQESSEAMSQLGSEMNTLTEGEDGEEKPSVIENLLGLDADSTMEEKFLAAGDKIKDGLGVVNDIIQIQTLARLASVDKAEKAGTITAKQAEEERTKIKEEQGKKQQAVSIATATITFAQGVITALSTAMQLGPIAGPIAGAINIAALGVAYGLNIAKIKSQKFAEGGHVQGAGTGTSDSIDAKLSNGEFVQTKKATDYYGVDYMKALNNMQLPKQHFAVGGLVQSPSSINNVSSSVSRGTQAGFDNIAENQQIEVINVESNFTSKQKQVANVESSTTY